MGDDIALCDVVVEGSQRHGRSRMVDGALHTQLCGRQPASGGLGQQHCMSH